MTIKHYIILLETLWGQLDFDAPNPRSVELVNSMSRILDRAMRHFPHSSDLWCMKGDLYFIQYLITNNQELAFVGRKSCYLTAIQNNTYNSYAYESLGHLYHLHNKYSEAARHFQLAIDLGGSPESYTGLAMVLAEMGRRALAIKCLEDATEKFGGNDDVDKARNQIEHGEWGPPAANERGTGNVGGPL